MLASLLKSNRLSTLALLLLCVGIHACAGQTDISHFDVIEKSRIENPSWLAEASELAGSGIYSLSSDPSQQRLVILRRQVRDIKLAIKQEKANFTTRLLRAQKSQKDDKSAKDAKNLIGEAGPQILDIYYEKRRDFTNPLASSGFDLYVLVGLREDRPSAL